MGFLVEALAALGLATGVTHSSLAYALVSAMHILGIALLLGPILLVDLALLGLIARQDSATSTLLRRTAMTGIALTLATGLLLLGARPHEYLVKPVVWAKLTLITLAIANALAFERGMARATAQTAARLHAALSLALWLGVLLLGRWIAFA